MGRRDDVELHAAAAYLSLLLPSANPPATAPATAEGFRGKMQALIHPELCDFEGGRPIREEEENPRKSLRPSVIGMECNSM
ncbi:hypothetical protein GUJ93_ZPchr0013g36686 [Zizania palustris]|uniref:Uncharacterized protein n=1 Tax=Zizania palustris TaxID=103762 RepID=A0A8J6BYI6_ZIZPA|nr:hypothetical protein GUJ93_ZPchr0013g36686 [Zizania palustris]